MSQILSFNNETDKHIDVTINGSSGSTSVVNDTATIAYTILGVPTLEVADITDPSSELSAYAGTLPGELVVCYQVEADLNNKYTLYTYDEDSRESDTIPYVVTETGTEGAWIAIGGRYNYWEYFQLTDSFIPYATTVGESQQLVDSPIAITYIDGEPQITIYPEVGGASEDYRVNISPSYGGNAGSAIVQVSTNQTNDEPYANIEASATAASVKAVYNTTAGPVFNRYALLSATNTNERLELGFDSNSYFTLTADAGSGPVGLVTPAAAPSAGQYLCQNAANNRLEFRAIAAGEVTPAMVANGQYADEQLTTIGIGTWTANVYTAGNTERNFACHSGSTARTLVLPDAAPGRIVRVTKVDTGTGQITLDGAGSDTINGATTVVLAGTRYKYGVLLGISNSEWIIVSSN